MSYVLRPYRRFPVDLAVTYEHWFREGQGMVWNLSPTGWRMSGTLPLQCGDVCSLHVMLPTNQRLSITAGIVRWVKGEDFGVETLVMHRKAQSRLNGYIRDCMKLV